MACPTWMMTNSSTMGTTTKITASRATMATMVCPGTVL
jgi:hypothetical protein